VALETVRSPLQGNVQPIEKGHSGKTRSADLEIGGLRVADVGDRAGEGEDGCIGGASRWPTAANIFEGVEVAGGCAEALQINIHRLRGNEVGAAGTGEAKAGLYLAAADSALSVGGEDHVATESSVAAKEEAADCAERSVAPGAAQADRDLAE